MMFFARNRKETDRRRGSAVSAVAVVATAWLCLIGAAQAVSDFDWGFLASKDTTVSGNSRFRALGPLFETQTSPEGLAFSALRPIYSSLAEESRDRSLKEVLWPVGMFKDLGTDRHWRFALFYGNDYDTRDEDSRSRFVLFPLLFAGRNAQREKYLGLFPLGGTVHELLFQDKATFALFPLYLHTVTDDRESHSVLWPLFSTMRGDGIRRLRLFPFYGMSHNEGSWKKRFVCWPLWNSVSYEYPDAGGDGGFILFPFYGHIETPESETHWVLPPLFRFTRGDDHKQVYCPWPFYQRELTGEVDKTYVWPLWGRKRTGDVENGFFLWPVGSSERLTRKGETISRIRALPVLHLEKRTHAADVPVSEETAATPPAGPVALAAPEEIVTGRYVKVWPLFSYQRRGDISRFRTVDLWPARDARSVEKNYAPLWTFYSRTRQGDARESELLWGAYRHSRQADGSRHLSVFPIVETDRTSTGHQWSLLKGLVGYSRDGEARSVRLLYLLNLGFGGDADQ